MLCVGVVVAVVAVSGTSKIRSGEEFSFICVFLFFAILQKFQIRVLRTFPLVCVWCFFRVCACVVCVLVVVLVLVLVARGRTRITVEG